ncbi:MAG: manganese efflux pump [Bacteroidales bacterium]|nr:manganese efflux pump [Bacteroidales bacterium]
MHEYLYMVLMILPVALVAFNAAYWGGIYKCLCFSEVIFVGLAFMLFQSGLFYLGSWSGSSFANSLGWLAIPFSESILLLTGVKLIYSSIRLRPEQKSYDLAKYGELIAVAFASSLNAFMIGLGIGLLREITQDVIAIMSVAAGFATIAGAYLGKKIGRIRLVRVTGIVAGIVVILLGVATALDYFKFI